MAAEPANKRARVNEDNLECPICNEIPKGKIMQCDDGHLHCESCIAKIKECSICRKPIKKPTRNLFAEKIREDIDFKCNNIGCEQVVKGCVKLAEHEEVCVMNRCKNACGFMGTKDDVTQHVLHYCPIRTVKCYMRGCGIETVATNMYEHLISHNIEVLPMEYGQRVFMFDIKKLPVGGEKIFRICKVDNDIFVIIVRHIASDDLYIQSRAFRLSGKIRSCELKVSTYSRRFHITVKTGTNTDNPITIPRLFLQSECLNFEIMFD